MTANRTKKPALAERAGVALAKCALPAVLFLWGDLAPRAQRVWAWLFWLLSWPFFHGIRKVVAANLRVAFPQRSAAERRKIGHRSFLHLFGLGLDWLHFLKHPEECTKRLILSDDFRRECTKTNPDARARVALYCTPHLGNWEMESRISFLTGRPGAVVVARFGIEWFNELAERLRTQGDDTAIIPADGAAMGVLRALLSGRDVGLLIDQNISPKHGGIFRNFFGLPATTSRMPASIARKLRIPIYVVACIKQPDGMFRMEYEPLPKNAWEYESDEELTGEIFAAYERLIRRHPEQYLWGYTRWRYLPANADDVTAAKFPYYARRKQYTCPEEVLHP